MDSHSKTPTVKEIVEAISRADPQDLNDNYQTVVRAMQARMMQDQKAFK